MKFDGTDTPDAAIADSVEAIAAGTSVLSLATADADGDAHANMAFFALGPEFDLFFVSEPDTRHGRNVAARPRCAAAIWLPPPLYGEGLQGIQMTGECGIGHGDIALAAFDAYHGRFPAFGADPVIREAYLAGTAPSRLYRFRVQALTMVDEPALGRRNYLNLTVVR